MCLCIQGAFSVEAVTSRRHNALLSPLALASTCVLTASWGKIVCSIKIFQGNRERVSLWCQEVPLFRHKQIELLVSSFLGNYFCIHLFISCFFFLHVIAFFSYLIPAVLFHILLGWLFGWLVGFYCISTFVGYLTANSVYMYIRST